MSFHRWSLILISVVLLLVVGALPVTAQPDLVPLPAAATSQGIVQRAPFEVAAHLLPPATRLAQAYTVTRFDDPAVGECNANDGMSLREAIFHCATVTVQPTIYLPAGTYTLSSSITTSARSFFLIGESPLNTFIEPAAGVRAFDLGLAVALPPTTVTIANVTIQNSTSGASGNALRVVGGGIINLDNLRVRNNTGSVRGTVRFDVETNARMTVGISNMTVTNNTASAGAGIAITNELGSGTITASITDSAITNNTATGIGGNLLVNNTSGALTSVVINNSTLSGGGAGSGGGIGVSGDATPTTVTLNGTTISGNTATTSGGGIYFDSVAGELLLQNSTVSANSVTNNSSTGGGLYAQSGRQFTFRGTLFVSNTAVNGIAGAMQFNTNVAAVTLDDTVVRDNSAQSVGGLYAFLVDSLTANRLTVTGNTASTEVGGALFAASNTVSLTDSSFTLNSAGVEIGGLFTARAVLHNVAIEDNSAPVAPDCQFNALSGESYSLGEVFITDTSGCTGNFTPAESDLLGNLVANGGFEFQGTAPKFPAGWNVAKLTGDRRFCNSLTVTLTPYGNCLMRFSGSAGEAATLTQNIDLTGLTFTAGEELRLTAFGDGANANSRLRIRVTVRYADQPNNQVSLLFTGNHTGLTRASQVITLSSASVTSITVRITHLSPGGRFLLERVYLTR